MIDHYFESCVNLNKKVTCMNKRFGVIGLLAEYGCIRPLIAYMNGKIQRIPTKNKSLLMFAALWYKFI